MQSLLFLCLGYLDIGSDALDSPLTDTFHERQIIDAAERTVFRSVRNDRLGFRGSNSIEFSRDGFSVSRIDVHLSGEQEDRQCQQNERSHGG